MEQKLPIEIENVVLVMEGMGVNPSGKNTYFAFQSVEEAKKWIKYSKAICRNNPTDGYSEEEWEEYVDGSYELIETPNNWELKQAEWA